jgi:hypothetical protein
MAKAWATDTNVSLPLGPPANRPMAVDLGGFIFTTGGISHPLNPSDAQEIIANLYSPTLPHD